MELDKETQQKIRQLQIFEQNIQALLMQKQAFQMELTETENALAEIAKSDGEVYKLVGQIMVKSDKTKIESELKRKQELLSLRLKTFDKQESELTEQSEELRKEVMKKIK
ncbi:MAG: prefoldin subunit beta [Candidatus Pacearchaeota archaeon]|jgi:prefoldin beta subunit